MRRAPFLLLVFALCYLLRIFYAELVWADEGLWFTAAQEMLRGATLYRHIWFDKPPGLAFTYAALFAPGVAPLLVVRLFTIFYSFAVALALWRMGQRFWGEREGQIAALLYAFYNATYIPSQVQPLAGDHLVLLPYLLAGFFFLEGRILSSGLLASLAFQINPKAAALVLFLAAHELLERRPGMLRRAALFLAGFLAGSIPWALYLAVGGKWPSYVRDFWGWGFSYINVYAPGEWLARGARRTLNYVGFHAPLFIGAGLLVRNRSFSLQPPAASLLLWLAASFAGVAAGGRFFPRYFYLVLPLLCLLAARGYVLYRSSQGHAFWRYAMLAGLLLSLVRFHHRTAALAWEAVSGGKTAYMAGWHDTAMDRDSRKIAARLGPRTLFVWGYRPEIYFYCGCRPANRWLSSQPLTGVPADIHLRESRSVAPIQAAVNRAVLATQLRFHPPAYIVDGLGPYNPELAMERYPELRDVLDLLYQREPEEVGHGIIYRLSVARRLRR